MFLKSEVKEEVERMEKQMARRQLLDGSGLGGARWACRGARSYVAAPAGM